MAYTLILLRHGQSAWNKSNQFTGWVDVPLTEQGIEEAKNGGRLMAEKHVLPDVLYTSMLRRSIETAFYALDQTDRLWIPVKRSWRLNERHYGDLQGKNKSAIRQEYGDKKFMLWRRSYATPPPAITDDNKYNQANEIEPQLQAGKTVMIAAHGNSLRAIVKMLDGLSEEEISKVNIPTGIPLVYKLDENFKPIVPRGEYLDPEAAAAGAKAVANQGR